MKILERILGFGKFLLRMMRVDVDLTSLEHIKTLAYGVARPFKLATLSSRYHAIVAVR